MDNRGYSKRIHDANQRASATSLGVLLGRLCLANDIPVLQIAQIFEVSRMTIYKWFTGKAEPRKKHHERILRILETSEVK